MWSSGWVKFWKELLLVADVKRTWVKVIFIYISEEISRNLSTRPAGHNIETGWCQKSYCWKTTRLFSALNFFVFFFRSLNPWIGSRENWTPAQKEDLTGWGMRIEINRGAVDIFGIKWIPRFSRNGEFPLVERRQKCHHLDNSWSWLRAGTSSGL